MPGRYAFRAARNRIRRPLHAPCGLVTMRLPERLQFAPSLGANPWPCSCVYRVCHLLEPPCGVYRLRPAAEQPSTQRSALTAWLNRTTCGFWGARLRSLSALPREFSRPTFLTGLAVMRAPVPRVKSALGVAYGKLFSRPAFCPAHLLFSCPTGLR